MSEDLGEKINTDLDKVYERLFPGLIPELAAAGVGRGRVHALYPLDGPSLVRLLADVLVEPAQVKHFEKSMRTGIGVGVLSYLGDTLPEAFSDARDAHSLVGGRGFEPKIDVLNERLLLADDEGQESWLLHNRLRSALLRAADITWFATNWERIPNWIDPGKLLNVHDLTRALKRTLPKAKDLESQPQSV